MADFPQGPVPGNQPPWPAQGAPSGFPAPAQPSRVPMFIAIAVAIAALAVAIASWFRPAPEPVEAAPTFTDAEIAEAKAKVCDAYKLSGDAIAMTAGRVPGEDLTEKLAIVAHTRLASFGGPQYMLNVLSENPAAPNDITQSVREYASSYQQLALKLLAEQTDIDSVVTAGDAANEKLKQACP